MLIFILCVFYFLEICSFLLRHSIFAEIYKCWWTFMICCCIVLHLIGICRNMWFVRSFVCPMFVFSVSASHQCNSTCTWLMYIIQSPESGRTGPSARIWPNPPVRPNPAELRFGTAVRIRPNSDLGRPSESGRTQIGDGLSLIHI